MTSRGFDKSLRAAPSQRFSIDVKGLLKCDKYYYAPQWLLERLNPDSDKCTAAVAHKMWFRDLDFMFGDYNYESPELQCSAAIILLYQCCQAGCYCIYLLLHHPHKVIIFLPFSYSTCIHI